MGIWGLEIGDLAQSPIIFYIYKYFFLCEGYLILYFSLLIQKPGVGLANLAFVSKSLSSLPDISKWNTNINLSFLHFLLKAYIDFYLYKFLHHAFSLLSPSCLYISPSVYLYKSFPS